MTDRDIFELINGLSAEEERLFADAGDGGGLSTEDVQRLSDIKVQLDRCYDLLHQRQARRDAGLDPAEAEPRTASVVEGYEQ